MPRAHLSKRLPDEEAIRLFAEHHIVHVRRRKNGEIVAVKHSVFGWMEPSRYYALQKVHDAVPLITEVIRGGYQMKWALASIQFEVKDVSLPVGGAIYAGAASTALILMTDPLSWVRRLSPLADLLLPDLSGEDLVKVRKTGFDEGSLLLAGIMLPYGEVLLFWALYRMSQGLTFRWTDLAREITVLPALLGLHPFRVEEPGPSPHPWPGPPPHGG